MHQRLVRAAFITALFCTATVASVSLPCTAVQAADKVGKAVGVPLSAAQKSAEAKDWAGALASIKQAQAVPDRSPYEDYVINKFLSIVAINMNDMNTARTAAEAALASPAMPPEDKKDLLHNAFILEASANSYSGIIQYGKQLEALGPLDPEQLANLAIAYYNTKDTASAQQYAQKSIDAAKAAGKEPPQAALEITMNAQAQSNPAAAEQTLENIVLQSGSPQDWDRLIEYDLSTKGMNDVFAMDLYRLKYVTHSTKPADATIVGPLATQLRYYGDAVTILKATGGAGAALKAAEANAAKEQGLLNTEIAAAKKGNATVALNVAEALYGYGRYADAEALAREASQKGGGKYPGQAQLLIGMSLTAQGKHAEAIQAFNDVKGTAAALKTAKLWSIYAQRQAGGATATH
ncbi:MAG: tetratricopeptide repeat protein [Alphaproteobacteria bacterium]|nr:tetratricopeptide repeat protein [Alphaproteobacteria bacterium]MBV9062927.1 tetratricopeptide repeat protein [Alphaproteobacteria bacterium]